MEISFIQPIVSAIALAALAIVSFWQLRALRRQMTFDTFLKLMDDLDNEQTRKDREIIYRLTREGVTEEVTTRVATDVTERNTKYAIERTVKNLDKVGFILLRGHSRRKEAPIWIWERAVNMWARLEPFVYSFRKQPGRRCYAIYFEELAIEARKYIKN